MKKLMVYSHDSAVRDTIEGFEKTGSPVITDDCGFSPFGADISTSRKTAFEKIGARVAGTMRPRPSGSDRENSIMTRYYDNEGFLNLYYLLYKL